MPIFRVVASSIAELEHAVEQALQMQNQEDIHKLCDFTPAPLQISLYYSDIAELHSRLADITLPQQTSSKVQWCLLFTGQGSQITNMGVDVCTHAPFIQGSISKYTELFAAYGADIKNFFTHGHDERIHQTQYTQMCLVSLQLAICDFWRQLGLPISCAIGHSIGELAACIDAGFYDYDQGLQLVFERAHRMQAITAKGTMLAVRADKATVADFLAVQCQNRYNDVEFAGFNSPMQTILSGPIASIDALHGLMSQHKIKSIRLSVSHAFHSNMMRPMLSGFQDAIVNIKPHLQARYTVFSNLDGHVLAAENLDSSYWAEQLRNPVDFIACANSAYNSGNSHFLEVGPQPILCGLLAKILGQESNLVTLHSLNKRLPAHISLLNTACYIDSYYSPLDLSKFAHY